jgi:NAD(P)-dependent dehydrogenase (short-subunit alcohol dehydrogenase family)
MSGSSNRRADKKRYRLSMQNKRVAVVTGANQGIGFQIAKELAANDLIVYVGSRNLARGEEAAKTLGANARALQLDVTDSASIAAAAKRIRDESGRLDVLINNAAISNTTKRGDQSLQDYGNATRASTISLDEVRAIWETNAFGALAMYQAMLPLLREAKHANVVNVSSGVGSLTRNSDASYWARKMYSPGYAASKTAMNAMSVAMAIECEGTSIKVNACSPGFTKTNLNGNEGTDTVEQGASEAVRLALIGPDGPHNGFTHATLGTLPW